MNKALWRMATRLFTRGVLWKWTRIHANENQSCIRVYQRPFAVEKSC
jgi:hypothetical protein